MLDYLLIGHIAQDVAPEGFRLGGTVAYSAVMAQALGMRVGAVTSFADGANIAGLEKIQLHQIKSARSTIFENVYTPTGRVQTLHARAEVIKGNSIPREWRSAPIVHFAPIANEIDSDVADQFPDSLLCLTPQGFMRVWDERGHVSRGEWTSAGQLLQRAAASVMSIEDVAGDWPLAEQWAAQAKIFVVTQAEQGATLYVRGEKFTYPAPQVEVVEATGAGDIFAAAFFVRLWQTRDPHLAVRFAIALASDSVTRVGVQSIPSKEFIERSGKIS